MYPNSTLPDCLQRSSAHGRRERQRCPLPRLGRTSFALAHPWKMLAPDMVSIPRIRAEVHRPAIRAPTCVCASSCFWTDRLTVSVPIKRKSTAWPPPDTVHLRNQNPLTVRRYPGAVCHPGYSVGRYISRSPARLSVAVATPICWPVLISENTTCCLSAHVSPDAFGRISWGSPPRTGTTQVFHPKFESVAV